MDTKQQLETWLDTLTITLRPLASIPNQLARKTDPFCAQLAPLLVDDQITFGEATEGVESALEALEDEYLRLGGSRGAMLLVRVVRATLENGQLSEEGRLQRSMRWVSQVQSLVNQVTRARRRDSTPSPEDERKPKVDQDTLLDARPPFTPSQATPHSLSPRPSQRPPIDSRGFPGNKRSRSRSRSAFLPPTPLSISVPRSGEGFDVGACVLAVDDEDRFDDWPGLVLNGAEAPVSTQGERTLSSLLLACPPCVDEWFWYEPSALSLLTPEQAKTILAAGAPPGVDPDTRGLWEEALETAISRKEWERWKVKALEALEEELRRDRLGEEGQGPGSAA